MGRQLNAGLDENCIQKVKSQILFFCVFMCCACNKVRERTTLTSLKLHITNPPTIMNKKLEANLGRVIVGKTVAFTEESDSRKAGDLAYMPFHNLPTVTHNPNFSVRYLSKKCLSAKGQLPLPVLY